MQAEEEYLSDVGRIKQLLVAKCDGVMIFEKKSLDKCSHNVNAVCLHQSIFFETYKMRHKSLTNTGIALLLKLFTEGT